MTAVKRFSSKLKESLVRQIGNYEIYYDEKDGSQYKGKFVIIQKGKIIDVKDTEPDAVDYIENVLMKECSVKFVEVESIMTGKAKTFLKNCIDAVRREIKSGKSVDDAIMCVVDCFGLEGSSVVDYLYDFFKEYESVNVNGIVNKILEGGDVREALCNKLDEGFSEEFKQEIINNPVNKNVTSAVNNILEGADVRTSLSRAKLMEDYDDDEDEEDNNYISVGVMTVGELKSNLNSFDDDDPVVIKGTNSHYVDSIYDVKKKKIRGFYGEDFEAPVIIADDQIGSI